LPVCLRACSPALPACLPALLSRLRPLPSPLQVVPYIASGYRRDKIWLRRTKPSARHYQLLLAVDDSESMALSGAAPLAVEAVAALLGGLSQLEVGSVGVVAFAESVRLLHPPDEPLTPAATERVLGDFTFAGGSTAMGSLMTSAVGLLADQRARAGAPGGSGLETMQLLLIVSDGRRTPTWGDPGPLVRAAAQQGVRVCFLVLDSPTPTPTPTAAAAAAAPAAAAPAPPLGAAAALRADRAARAASGKGVHEGSIIELQSVSYPNGVLTISRWIDRFPFPFYLLLRDVRALPHALADTVRQWVELLTAERG
jgi:midasin